MIGKDKTRILLTLPKDLKEDLTKEAEAENRSLNNYLITKLLKRDK
jgi:predicted HicB family RNase H-like nuclease